MRSKGQQKNEKKDKQLLRKITAVGSVWVNYFKMHLRSKLFASPSQALDLNVARLRLYLIVSKKTIARKATKTYALRKPTCWRLFDVQSLY